ncbi:MAG: hypothetical protein V1896_00015 [Candidatus Zambryskibacteria bacterium]
MGEIKHEIYITKEWVPELASVAQSVIDDVYKVAPGLEVLFMGAAALGLPGKNDIDLDILISDPTISHVPEQKHVFDMFKSDPQLLEEYRQLKISCNGLPYQEYEERKKEFFKTRIPKT